MACKQDIKSMAKTEYKRLKAMLEDGYTEDLDNGIGDIEEAMSVMQGIYKENRNQVVHLAGDINEDVIARLNANSPRVKNSPVTVISGKVTNAGKVIYKVKYENSDKQYSYNGALLTANQVDPKQMAIDSMDGTLYNRDDMKAHEKLDKFWKKFTDLELDIHKDASRVVEMLDELDNIDGNKTNPEHMKYLRGLLGSIDPKFFKSMKVYLNDAAKETGGVITNSRIGIMIDKAAQYVSNDMTAAEVYAHELVHAYTKFVVDMAKKTDADVAAKAIYRQLQKVMRIAAEHTTWQDMLGDVEVANASTKEIENAKDMYNYIFNHKNAEHEFIAHVLTNPIVMNKAKSIQIKEQAKSKSLLDYIKDLAQQVIGYMMGEYKFKDKNKNVYEVTSELAMMFAEYNYKAKVKAKEGQSLLSRMSEAISTLDEAASDKLKELLAKVDDNSSIGSMPADKLGQAKWMAKMLKKAVLNREYRAVVMTYLDKLGWLNISGSIGSIIRDFVESSELEKKVDWLQLQADKIDQAKMNVMSVVNDSIRSGFKSPLSVKEDEALTSVLVDTDVQSILGKSLSMRQLKSYLKDSVALEKAIGRAKSKIDKMTNDSDKRNWYKTQASGLGYYLATGKGHIAQNVNAYNIARGYLSGSHIKGYNKVPGDIEAIIDEIATLTGLLYSNDKDKSMVLDLISKDKDGVENIINTHQMLNKEASTGVFKDQKVFMIKGHSKEIFDDMITVEIAKVSEKDVMEQNGFTLVSELKGHSALNNGEKFALYKSTSHATNNWHRAAVRLTSKHTKGTTLRDVGYASTTGFNSKKHIIAKAKLDTVRYGIVADIMKGTFDIEKVEMGMLPLLNEDGYVSDYRYVMEKEVKKDLLKQDRKVTEVLGATKGTLLDKTRSIESNKKILQTMVEDAKENYVPGNSIGKEGIEYVLIKEDSTDDYIKELWKVLPPEFRMVAKMYAEQGLPVRKDMLLNYFGYRELSFADFPGLSKMMPTVMKSAIKIAEYIWQEFIKISKVDILIKMPVVIVGNIISNVLFAINSGSGPVELIKMYLDSTRDVRSYLTAHRRLLAIENKVSLGKGTAADKTMIEMLKRQLKDSPIHELYELGVYQAIVEDASKEELGSKNRLKNKYKEATASVPKIVKDGVNWLYLTEETQYYKFMTEVLQMSDLVARDVENRKMKKMNELYATGKKRLPMWYVEHLNESKSKMASMRRVKGDTKNRDRKLSDEERKYFREVADEYRKNYVLNSFINYNKVSGPMEEYLNKMGFIMFTKYAKRIQLVLGKAMINHPLRSLTLLAADNFMFHDNLEMIHDQSLFTRSWYNMTPQWPWERILEVFTPALVQMPSKI